MPEKEDIPLHRERLGLLDKDAQQKLLEKKRKTLSKDMAMTFNTVEGRRVLRFILTICGYKKGVIGGNAALGMDVMQGTLYNASRQQVAVEILEHIPAHIVKNVEYGTDEDIEL